MTSEIAVMNRLAVALAADSAVTVGAGQRNKVYNSANKLFMLSRRHPVGVMVYNNGLLLGVPWETLIKVFRDELGDQEFARLEEYAQAFLDFVESKAELFTPELQTRYFLDMVRAHYSEIARTIRYRIEQAEAKADETTDRATLRSSLVAEEIRIVHAAWAELELSPSLTAGIGDQLRGQCSGEISKLVTQYFRTKSWVAEQDEVRLLTELAGLWVDRDSVPDSTFSGVVVAGFGRDDFFPVLRSYGIGEIYGGKLKVDMDETVRISESEPVHIGIFADSDMSNVFLQGISEDAEAMLVKRAYQAAEELTTKAIEACPTPEAKAALEGVLDATRDEVMERFVNDMGTFKRDRNELENALTHAPKDEIASVATSLVNLNSFKKRMSMSLETVGGPVDVAVISKGDGFIWIDRKHYFQAGLNPHFVTNRYASRPPISEEQP
ncbi:MAG: hypothetical protein JWP35_4507 [Caulobacter sp.]|nr:hypothetical protein [Caulobacter sp.]